MRFSAASLSFFCRVVWILFGVTLAAGMALYGWIPHVMNVDLGWHLAQGRWMFEHGQIYQQDMFNYSNFGRPFVQEYAFYQALVWLACQGGDLGLALLAGLMLALLAGLTLWLLWRSGQPLLLAAFLGLSIMILCSDRLNIRPELFTYLGLVSFGLVLQANRGKPQVSAYWPLVPLQLVWVNSHSGFILGPAMVGMFAAEEMAGEWRQGKKIPGGTVRKWMGVAALLAAACLATPAGWKRTLLPFFHQGSFAIGAYVEEMKPMVLDLAHPGFWLLALFLAVLLGSVIAGWRRVHWGVALLWLFFLALSFGRERHLAVMAFLTPALFLPAPRKPQGAAGSWASLLGMAVLLAACGSFLLHWDRRAIWSNYEADDFFQPRGIVEWMKEHRVEGRVLHRAELGGWLQFHGFTEKQTIGDTGFGKYPEHVIRHLGLLWTHPSALPALADFYRADFCLVSLFASDWIPVLEKTGWECVYFYKSGSLWVRAGARPDLIRLNRGEVGAFIREQAMGRYEPPLFFDIWLCRIMSLRAWGFEPEAIQGLLSAPPPLQTSRAFWEAMEKFCEGPGGFPPGFLGVARTLADLPANRNSSRIFRAKMAMTEGHLEEARSLLAQLLHVRGNTAGFEMLARLHVQKGKWEDAWELLEKDACFDPSSGVRRWLQAQCRVHQGSKSEAAAFYREALYFMPFDSGLRHEVEIFLSEYPDSALQKALSSPLE